MDRRWKIFLIVGVVSLVADLGTKYWAEAALEMTPAGIGIPVPFIENFWDWRLSYNTGSAFGLFGSVTGARIFLSLIGLVALGAVVYWVRKTPEEMTRLLAALGMVAGGAIGNLYDRLLYGKVTDFVVWKYYDKQWPTFNIADVALVVGVALLFLDLGKLEKAQKAAKEAAEAEKESKSGKGKKKRK
ncbi:MAG: signal peptidase II [Deltaproteobacteria bacterium]|nr:signal peptidase II [Deltaproteobacteria bacterium]